MNFLLQNSDLDDEHPEWRMHWVYGVTMLRTVGHVLDKVDGVRSNLHRSAVSSFWRNWKSNRMQHWVFWEFIEQERNNLLKTFNFGVELDEQGLWYPSLEMDGVQLLREATYWWRRQLEELEEKLGV